MPRFFVEFPLQTASDVALPEDVVRHIHVLRLKLGDTVTVFNGQGGEYAGTLTSIEKKHATLVLHTHLSREAESRLRVTLAQGIAGGDKMDWLIEKAVELGVAAIQPLQTERCVVRLQGERATKRTAHWQALVQAACEQSGRNRIPQVSTIVSLRAWLAQVPSKTQTCVLLSPRANQSLGEWFAQAKHSATLTDITLLIGPEGGLSAEEEHMACQAGCVTVSLGTRILRTETAGLAVLAALNALNGEF